jgi:hypothetical protein
VASLVHAASGMNDFDRNPGAIDDPGMKGGIGPDERTLPPADTAGDTGGPSEPEPAELDLPGPEDPVAWSYVEPGTDVVGREGVKIGKVDQMLGTEAENIFHGIALKPATGGEARIIPADAVTSLTPSEVHVQVSTDEVESLAAFQPGD